MVSSQDTIASIRGEQRPDSDIDPLVEFDPGRKTFDTFTELSFFPEEALEYRR
jgi:uncharacterized protein